MRSSSVTRARPTSSAGPVPQVRAGLAAASDGLITAPMPGTVLSVRVSEGQDVTAGEVLGVLEAMKMELSLVAPYDGTVTEAGVKAGDRVALGQQIFVVVPGPSGSGTGVTMVDHRLEPASTRSCARP